MKDYVRFFGLIACVISPLIPFRLMDLGSGLTSVSFRQYFSAIIVISFFRILWLQFILAGIGTNLLNDFSALQNYFFNNPRVIQYSALYFLAVIVITITAFAVRFIKKRKEKNYGSAKWKNHEIIILFYSRGVYYKKSSLLWNFCLRYL